MKKKLKLNFWILDPIFRKFDKKRLCPKKSNFRKSDFWCQKRGSRAKITTGWYFLGQKLKKKRFFFKIFKNLRSYDFFSMRQNPGWLRGLSLKTVSTLNRRTWWCCPLKIHSEPEQLGHVDFDDMTKRANFVLSCLYFEWKA